MSRKPAVTRTKFLFDPDTISSSVRVSDQARNEAIREELWKRTEYKNSRFTLDERHAIEMFFRSDCRESTGGLPKLRGLSDKKPEWVSRNQGGNSNSEGRGKRRRGRVPVTVPNHPDRAIICRQLKQDFQPGGWKPLPYNVNYASLAASPEFQATSKVIINQRGKIKARTRMKAGRAKAGTTAAASDISESASPSRPGPSRASPSLPGPSRASPSHSGPSRASPSHSASPSRQLYRLVYNPPRTSPSVGHQSASRSRNSRAENASSVGRSRSISGRPSRNSSSQNSSSRNSNSGNTGNSSRAPRAGPSHPQADTSDLVFTTKRDKTEVFVHIKGGFMLAIIPWSFSTTCPNISIIANLKRLFAAGVLYGPRANEDFVQNTLGVTLAKDYWMHDKDRKYAELCAQLKRYATS